MKKILGSLAANSRDIAGTLILIIGILFAANILSEIGAWFKIDLSDTKDFIFAAAKFAAVALFGVGYLSHVTFRQSLGDHDLNEFMDTWKSLDPKDRLEWFLKISIAGIIAASIIFGIGV